MGIVEVVLIVLVCGFVAWLLGLTPIPEPFRQIIQYLLIFIAVFIVVMWALSFVGVAHPQFNFR